MSQGGEATPSVTLSGVTKRFGDFTAIRDMDRWITLPLSVWQRPDEVEVA
jgi:hypothetical protein